MVVLTARAKPSIRACSVFCRASCCRGRSALSVRKHARPRPSNAIFCLCQELRPKVSEIGRGAISPSPGAGLAAAAACPLGGGVPVRVRVRKIELLLA